MLKNYFKKLQEFFKIIIPNGKREYQILFGFLIIYLSIGVYLSLQTNIIDDFEHYDMFFNFDNGICLYHGSDPKTIVTHPLSNLFYTPIILLNKIIVFFGFSLKIYTLSVVFLCALFVSYSNLFVFKYLKNIIELNMDSCLIITVLYSVFGGNIILSFTPDTFTFTLFLLTSFIYITSYYIKNDKKISLFYYIISGILISGQTITNAPKVLIPILFEKNKINKKIKQICFIVLIISLIISIKIGLLDIISSNLDRQKNFADFTSPCLKTFISYFFGGNIIIPKLFTESSIEMTYYNHIYQFFFIYFIIFLIIISIILNIKNKFVWILILSFGVDLFYFFVLRVALYSSFIYGGHFIFVIPIFIGWLLNSLKYNYQNVLKIFIYIMIFILVVNNGYKIIQFAHYARLLFPYN